MSYPLDFLLFFNWIHFTYQEQVIAIALWAYQDNSQYNCFEE